MLVGRRKWDCAGLSSSVVQEAHDGGRLPLVTVLRETVALLGRRRPGRRAGGLHYGHAPPQSKQQGHEDGG